MKKIILLLTMLIILSTMSYANYLTIENIKVYHNEVRVREADANGGDIEDVRANDYLEFRIDLKNNDNHSLDDILVFGEIEDIDDGTDMDKDLSEFDMRPGEELRKIISFTIPSDAEEDEYPLNIILRAITDNGTEETFEANYYIDVIKKKETLFDLEQSLANLTGYCKTISEDNTAVKTKVQDIVDSAIIENERDSCRTERDLCITQRGEVDEQFDECEINLENATRDVRILQGDIFVKDGEIRNLKDEAERKEKDKETLIFIGILCGGAGAIWWYKKKQLGGGKVPFDTSTPVKKTTLW